MYQNRKVYAHVTAMITDYFWILVRLSVGLKVEMILEFFIHLLKSRATGANIIRDNYQGWQIEKVCISTKNSIWHP